MRELSSSPIWKRVGTIVAFLATTLLCRPAEAAPKKEAGVPDVGHACHRCGCRWTGTIKVQAVGSIYDEEGELALVFTESKDGSVNGRADFRRTANRQHFLSTTSCTYTRYVGC